MEGNKFLSALAGAIIGFLLGTLFYLCPTKCLMAGPIVNDNIMLPDGMQQMILLLSAKYGGVAGAIIGILGGLAIPITVPHGHMSRSIAGISLIVCTIMAFIQHGHFLMEMTLGRIAITFLWVVMMFFFAIPISGMVKFIERMRE